MLPAQRNKLTISILSRLKDKGAPAPMVKPFPLLGEEQPEEEQASEGQADTDGSDIEEIQQPRLPRRKKIRLPGPSEV